MHELIENMSPASKVNGERNLEIDGGSKFPSSGSPYSCQKKMDMEEGDAAKKHQMPPASVMTRLILIMVWRKLIRNPNTYSSLLGLIWSLVSYRYQTKPKRYIFHTMNNQSNHNLTSKFLSIDSVATGGTSKCQLLCLDQYQYYPMQAWEWPCSV